MGKIYAKDIIRKKAQGGIQLPSSREFFWDSEWFPDFLKWLVDEHDYNAYSIINVVEAPHKWRRDWDEFAQFMLSGEMPQPPSQNDEEAGTY